jgi:hypothetical protein
MGVRFKLGGMSPLLPDEVVLHSQKRFRAISSTCVPSYRIGFQMPPLILMTLHVTNRRLLLVCKLFPFITQEIDLWFEGKKPEDRTELITNISVTSGLFGRCLEVRSRDPRRRQRWLWSPDLTLRFFFKNPDEVEAIIRKAMIQEDTARRLAGTDPRAMGVRR